jgi:hypothetical protein
MNRILAVAVVSLVFAVRAWAGPAPAQPTAMPRAAQEEYDLGVTASDQKEWALAIRHFTAAQAQAPDHPKILYNLGVAHSQLDHLAGAAWLHAYLAADPTADADKTARVQKEIRRLDSVARLKVEKLLDTAIKVADQYVLPYTTVPAMPWMPIPTVAPWVVGSDASPAPMLQIDKDLKQTERYMKLWLKRDVVDCAACVLGPEAALALDKEIRGSDEASQKRDEARYFQHFRQLWEIKDYQGVQELYLANKARFDARAAAVAKDPRAESDTETGTCADRTFMDILRDEGRPTLAKAFAAKAEEALRRHLTPADWSGLAKAIDDEERNLDIDGKIAAAAKDARSATCGDIARLAVHLGQCRLKVLALERIAEAQEAEKKDAPASRP